MCGDRVPLRHTLPGMAIESLVVVAVVVLAAAALIWLRQSGRGLVTDAERTAETEVVTQLPTGVPTFTRAPGPTSTRAINTVPPPVTPLPATVVHEVRSGDTLFGIAQQYGVTADDIIELNELVRPDALWIGQELTVPLRRDEPTGDDEQIAMADEDGEAVDEEPVDEGAEDAEASADDVQGEDGAETDEQAPGETDGSPGPTGQPLVIGEPEIHIVARGESIGVISANYDISIDELLELNSDRLSGPNDTLYVGDEVVVRAGAVVTTTPEPVAAAATHAPGQEPVGGTAGEMLAVPFEPAGESEFPAPMPLAPAGGITVTSESLLLRWSSAGVLPRGLFYVVAIREAAEAGASGIGERPLESGGRPDDGSEAGARADAEAVADGGPTTGKLEPEARLVWVTDATAVRIPSDLRPALGTSRGIEWSVSVRRRSGGGLLGREDSVLLSPEPLWQRFLWAPSAVLDEGLQPAP
jgi:LysM repeat protein